MNECENRPRAEREVRGWVGNNKRVSEQRSESKLTHSRSAVIVFNRVVANSRSHKELGNEFSLITVLFMRCLREERLVGEARASFDD